jgi:quercetin dioxygenase-like cupin family protein
VRLVATNVRGVVVKGSGHWLIDEAPAEVIPAIVAFLSARADPGQRLTPAEMASVATSSGAAGTSGVAGIETTILQGDPAAGGLYTIMLKVPPHTQIQAHKHPDERVGTVISGTWYFGYGASFEERALKALPPGSFYTEPLHRLHFAKTGDTSAVVHITGVGPTGTHYPAEARHPKRT